jgi:hypothetical protein
VYANVDWLVLLGATLPPPFGLWLVVVKPQVGAGVVLFWILRREARWYSLALVGAALLLNYALLGIPSMTSAGAQASVFPLGLPVSALLMWWAIKKADIAYALPSSAFASPYYSMTSWLSLAPLARSWRWLLAVVVASWLVFALWRGSI